MANILNAVPVHISGCASDDCTADGSSIRYEERETDYTTDETAFHRHIWANALELTTHPQVSGRLTSGTGFSAFGLACHISGLGKW